MTGIAVTRDIVQQIIEKKLNPFGHVCRMSNDSLMKQVVSGIIEESTAEEGYENDGEMMGKNGVTIKIHSLSARWRQTAFKLNYANTAHVQLTDSAF